MGIQPALSNNTLENNTASVYGENIVTYCIFGEYVADDGTCKSCGSGVYTLTMDAAACLPCKSNTHCLGGYTVVLDEGYWRDSIYSDDIEHCYN